MASSLSGFAQSVSSAAIEDGSANRLKVTFSSAVTVTDNGAGFRLVGGAARIKNLVSGSGTATLIFALSDYVLPTDAFTLLHWPELSDARGSTAKLAALTAGVTNQATIYRGSGKLYYVSNTTSGATDTNNDGRNSSKPFKTVGRAQTSAVAGDYILLKRGDTFPAFKITKGGNSTAGPITYAAYGLASTTQPRITGEVCTVCTPPRENVAAILIHEPSYAAVNYLTIDNIRVINTRGGILAVSTSKDLVISNCTIEGSGTGTKAGIELVNTAGRTETFENPRILNNVVAQCENSITLSGYSYDGMYEVKGGVIENNVTKENRASDAADGITANRANFNGLVIRKNDVANYYDDGIDLFAAANVVVEYNKVHQPGTANVSGVGIKAGGLTQSDIVKGYRGGNVTVRYNTVYNIQNTGGKRLTGISTNKGASGKIYGNLVYNTGLYGIELDDPLDNNTSANWSVYNNTAVNTGKNGLKVYFTLTGTESTGQVFLANNILDGGDGQNDLEIGFDEGLTKANVNGKNNVLVNGRTSANYVGQNDKTAGASSLFVNAGSNDYRLKAGSPAINAGSTSVTSSLYSKDIRGYLVNGTPDIGAYEYGDKFPPATPAASTNAWLEAECATSVGTVWEIVNGSEASSGQYARVKSGNYSASNAPDASGQLSFSFSVSQAGNYKLFTRHKSLNGLDDSYWLKVNNGSWVQQGVNSDVDAFVWEQTAGTLALSSGANTITIGYREPDFRLDKLYVTLTGSLPTGQGSAATNCGGSARTASQ